MNDKRYDTNDEQLLESFFKEFGETGEPIADDGFTERVMNALPARQTAYRLRRYSQWLNVTAVIGTLAILIGLGFFTRLWEYLHGLLTYVVRSLLTYDYDGLLVRAILFLHRLPDMLPSATQLTAIAITIIVLMTLNIDRIAKRAAR